MQLTEKDERRFWAKTHCPQGHEYNEENTHIRKNGNRQCRVCGREQARARRARKEK